MYESFACDIRETAAADHRVFRAKSTRLPVKTATHVLIGFSLWLLFLQCLPASAAANLEIIVKSRTGKPVAETVVTVSAPRGAAAAPAATAESSFVVDQLGMRFVPEVLVVPVGSAVSFPNSDAVSHQVYSFSQAKRFQLALYKGSAHAPVRFDKPGLVVMGCNIHDEMVGYIYVTDARWYGKTDAEGKLLLADVATGDLDIAIWNPRIADARDTLKRTTKLADTPQVVEFRLQKDLRGTPEPRPRNPDWEY